ncbi:CAP domain-containing protein [Marinospirillum perlucidum]|uniref:CAP domain-containing protein n=1 Tax=Marinospirillum perlucidum TaxID=1982602 RepID=UPI000DF1C336|nr:CAP domain-containing protein [Marinospirillum perlucidum]
MLTAAAQKHSNDQRAHATLSHQGSDGSSFDQRISREGYQWQAARENLGGGYFASEEALVQAWMDSDGHCANLLAGDVTEMGIAASRKEDGSGYWTLKLARPLN